MLTKILYCVIQSTPSLLPGVLSTLTMSGDERTVGRTAVVTMSGLSDVPIAFPTLPGCLQCRI